MPNAITIRTTAPGAKEAAGDLDNVKTSMKGIGTTAGALGSVKDKLLDMTHNARLLHREAYGVKAFASALDQIAGTDFSKQINDVETLAEGAIGLKDIGGGIADAVGTGLDKLKSSTKVQSAMQGVGDFMGSGIGIATGVGLGAALAVAIDQGMQDAARHIHDDLGQVQAALGTDPIGAQKVEQSLGPWRGFVDITGQALQNLIPLGPGVQEVGTDMRNLIGDVDNAAGSMGTLYQQFRTGEREALPQFVSQASTLGQSWSDSLSSAATKGASDAAITAANEFVHDSRPPLIAGSNEAAHAAALALSDKAIWEKSAENITSNLVQGLHKAPSEIKSAMDDLTYAINHPLELEKDKAEIEGYLTSKKLATALASKNTTIQTQAQQTKEFLIGEWEKLTGKAYTAGDDASSNLQDGLNNNYGPAKGDARSFVADFNDILNGLRSHYTVGIDVNTNVSRIGKNDKHHAAGGHMAAGEPGIVGELGPERFVPDVPGTIIPHGATSQPQTIAVTVNLSTREFAAAQKHHAVVQSGAPAFR